jgi:phytoene synthase
MDPLVARSQAAIERGSKSFAVASRLFDTRTREGALLLYAWCRHCDDQIDEQTLGFRSAPRASAPARERLAALEEQTRRALTGAPVEGPAFAALGEVVRRHSIPDRHPLDLLRGFAMDVEGRRYETLSDCCRYCYHVAGVVGVMMAFVMGTSDEDTLDRAADLGIAFQMTNIARDVIEDAEAGRVYLPGEWLREAGVPDGEISRAEHRRAVSSVVGRLLGEADRYYASAEVGLARLPFRSAWAVAAARRVYRDIGRLVLRRGPRAWDRRVSTGGGRKVVLTLAAAGDAIGALSGERERAPKPRSGLWTRARDGQG